jgi:predicted nucleotidyltransferase
MPVSDQNIMLNIKATIKAVDPSAEVLLFGSRVRGDFHSDSDWDVLIIVDKEKLTWEDEKMFRHKLYDLELEIAQPISIFVYSRIEWYGKNSVTPFFESIQSEGKIL